jgi:hypothetical protein
MGTAAGRSGGGLEGASEDWFVAKRLAYIERVVRRFADKRGGYAPGLTLSPTPPTPSLFACRLGSGFGSDGFLSRGIRARRQSRCEDLGFVTLKDVLGVALGVPQQPLRVIQELHQL